VSIPLGYVTGPETLFGVGQVKHVDGAIRGSMPAGSPFTGPDGRTSAGALGVLVDDVLGYSIIDSLSDGIWTVSTEIWLHLLAPLPCDGQRIQAAARTLQPGSFAAGTLTDERGRQLATFSQRGRAVPDIPPAIVDLPAFDLPTGAVDVVDLLGLRAECEAMALTVTERLENPRRMLHGGISLCASEVVATRSRRSAGSALATSSIHIVHARAIPAASEVTFHATTQHAGRSLWVTDVVGVVDGRSCTIARVSAES